MLNSVDSTMNSEAKLKQGQEINKQDRRRTGANRRAAGDPGLVEMRRHPKIP